MITIAQTLAEASQQLASRSASPKLDAEQLLSQVLGQGRSYFYTWPERELSLVHQQQFHALLSRRLHGEPLAYILGEREFWSLPLQVTHATLIPRAETELLVEQALARLPEQQALRVADLGTGSGAIALAIAHERPLVQLVATDIAADTLAVAQANAQRLKLYNVEFRLGDWCAALSGQFDLIASNPPYIPEADPHLSHGDLPYEPRRALASGEDGLHALRSIAAHAQAYLKPGGWLLVEHGYDQGQSVPQLLHDYAWTQVQCYNDFAGQARLTVARKSC